MTTWWIPVGEGSALPKRGLDLASSSWEVTSKPCNILPEECPCLLGDFEPYECNTVIHGGNVSPIVSAWPPEGLKTKSSQSALSTCPSPNNNLDTKAQEAPLLGIPPCGHTSLLEKVSTSCMTPVGKDTWKLVSLDLPPGPLNLCLLVVISHNHEGNSEY